jgi:uncharacterized protein YbjT (DUF2867 family)
MKIVVIGGSGLIGSKVVNNLRQAGHEVVAASPSLGVNTLTGEGLAEALAGADVVVSAPNPPGFVDPGVLQYFQPTTPNTPAGQAPAGVRHHVALSVVGADRLPDSGYMRAKLAQERLIEASGVPYTILRATQFFEFLGAIAGPGTDGSGTDTVRVPDAPMQPLAGDDVAAVLADVAVGPPVNGMLEVAGPESLPIAAFVRKSLAANGDTRSVVADPQARYFGAALDKLGLTPSGANPRIGPTRFEAWLDRSAARV